MSLAGFIKEISQQESINFLLTNRIPRRYATLFMGWFSRIELYPVKKISLWLWGVFSGELDLSDAKKQNFKSLHDCFVRELKEGARIIDRKKDVLISPCDAIVGALGRVEKGIAYQAKGFPYKLDELLIDKHLMNKFENGSYITLRLKSTMYHHFHSPYDGDITEINYISGDTWNVNPIALNRIEKLYCKNERAVIELSLSDLGISVALVPVAAILVACMRFNFIDHALNLKYKGPNRIPCKATVKKGEELGYFEHGSTIIVFIPKELQICKTIHEGLEVRMGQSLCMLK